MVCFKMRHHQAGWLDRAVRLCVPFLLSCCVLIGPLPQIAHATEISALREGKPGIAIEPSISEQVKNGRALRRQISKAKRGAVVLIAEGYYAVSDLRINKSITLVGDGDVIIQSANKVQKGLFVPGIGVSLQVENITFRGAKAANSGDNNGAGIRHEGRDLTVIDCIFENNENGILSTGSQKGKIELHNSTFLNSGYGDGYSHGIYVSAGAQLTITQSRFIGTNVGHHVKSLAPTNTISGSYFDDVDKRTSYSIDLNKGGAAIIRNNFIVQRDSVSNYSIVHYSTERGGEPGSLTVTGNHFVNRHPKGRLVFNQTPIEPLLQKNIISNENGGRLNQD